MKKVSKNSALAQLTSLYSAICCLPQNQLNFYSRKLCSCYAWTVSGVIEHADIDSLRNSVISSINRNLAYYHTKTLKDLSIFLNYTFSKDDCIL